MSHQSIPRWTVLLLLAGSSILPVTVCVVLALSALLGAMGDGTGAQVLVYVGWAMGGLWCVCLTALLFVLALRALLEPEVRRESLFERERIPTEELDT